MKTAKTTYALFTITCASLLVAGFLMHKNKNIPQPEPTTVTLPEQVDEPTNNTPEKSLPVDISINFNPTHDHHHHERSAVYFDESLGLSIDSDQTKQGGYRTTSVDINEKHYHLDIADSEMLRKQGLSGRQQSHSDKGMLFIFEFPYRHGIWMKDMNFAIDIIWLDSEKQVVHIERNIGPDTYPTVFTPPTDALYVIELPAGSL